MGSALTIVNNTPDELHCIIGPDVAAFKVFTWILTAFQALVVIALSGGVLAEPEVVLVSGGLAEIIGITPQLAKAVIFAVGAGGNKALNQILDKLVSDQVAAIQKEGYRSVPSGGSLRFNDLTLSLWQQGNCKRVRRFEEDGQMFTISDELFMRPIFSGATDGSNIDHSVQFWIDKFGFENTIKTILKPPLGRASWGNTAGTIDEFIGTAAPTTSSPTTATAAPTSQITMAPTTGVPSTLNPTAQITLAPTVPFKCDVCRFSRTGSIENPEAIVSIPNNGSFTCAEIDTAGKDGRITETNCLLVIQFLRPCGCYLPNQQCWAPSSKAGKASRSNEDIF
ncbi:hypothetical protein ACHAXH_009647 [Discostella pseudostelligera]